MLSGEEMEFHALDSGSADPNTREKLLSQFMAQPVLKLKKGAQVMLIKNIDSSLVNGSLGIVQAFMDETCFNVYTRDEETYLRAQKPEGGSDDEENAKARKKINATLHKNMATSTRENFRHDFLALRRWRTSARTGFVWLTTYYLTAVMPVSSAAAARAMAWLRAATKRIASSGVRTPAMAPAASSPTL